MIKTKLFNAALALGFSASMLFGCASGVKMAEIPTTADPREEVSKLEIDQTTAVTKNVDVLAASEFKKSKNYLDRAKSAIEKGKAQNEILDSLRTGRGHLQEAYTISQNRQSKAEGLFSSRQMALIAGANTHSELRGDLDDLDAEVSAKADNLSNVSADKLADLQKRYVDLERRSVILNQLGKSQAIVNGAQKDGAKKKAPISLKKSELSLKTAESAISTNVSNPSGYQIAVNTANIDANQLLNVMKTIEQNGKNLAESAAIRMVAQNKTISGLTTDLDAVTAKSEADKTDLQAKNSELSNNMSLQNQKLVSANSKVKVQRVLEKARTQFSSEEAEAYQQGENLVIRLKQVNFASGRSDLPANSLALLAKVSEVAKSLNASQIMVEGHTDSIGTATENKKISEQRASAVASYFKSNGFPDVKIDSEGFGFKKPIATNKSKEGRAQNRRVDIIITPETLAQ